jgi:hypothetical protein
VETERKEDKDKGRKRRKRIGDRQTEILNRETCSLETIKMERQKKRQIKRKKKKKENRR